jgi:cation diffusion facilitator CzcD-associated flavoprotein CzcO
MTALRQPSADFAGPIYARWVPPELVRDQRIAVIGDAASLAQVVPALVRTAAFVKVFQDEPAWAGPSWASGLPRSVQRRVAAGTLRATIRDPWLRWQLTPHANVRVAGVTAGYVRALQATNCKLITWPIAGYVPEGLRTADGIEHHVDAIVNA